MVNYYLRKCKDLNLIEIQKTTKEKVLEEISEMELPISTKNMDKISKKLNIKYTNLKRVLKDLNIPFCRKPINQPEKSMKKVIYLPTLEIYNSLKEASEKTGVGISTISSHINGKKEKIDFMRYEDYLKLNTLND